MVEEIGRVEAVTRRAGSLSANISATEILENTRVGDSIAVSGVCLTVTRRSDRSFDVDMVPETIARTNLVHLRPGTRVNLERSLRLGDRLGGHFVLGHVDGLARVVADVGPAAGEKVLRLRCPDALRSMIAEKGSVALNGVSLTVAAVEEDGFSVALIPHTLKTTTLGEAAAGRDLNLEIDVLARYVARRLAGGQTPEGLTESWMRLEGYS